MNCFSTPTAFECVNLGMSIVPLSTSPNKHMQKYEGENKEAENRPVMEKKVVWMTLREIGFFLLILAAFWWNVYSVEILEKELWHLHFTSDLVLFCSILSLQTSLNKQVTLILSFFSACSRLVHLLKFGQQTNLFPLFIPSFDLFFFSFEESLLKS